MKAYKGFDENLKCKGFQYEVGTEYKTDSAELCKKGFHGCKNPFDVFNYYDPNFSRYAEVEIDAISSENSSDSKIVGKDIKIVAEIGLKGIIEAGIGFIFNSVKWCKKRRSATGDSSGAQATGDSSGAQATGDRSGAQATGDSSGAQATGYRSGAQATGYSSGAQATGDSSGAQATGDRSMASVNGLDSLATVDGRNAVACALGPQSKAKGTKDSWLVLAEWEENKIINIKSILVDEKTIKINTFYKLENNQIIEA